MAIKNKLNIKKNGVYYTPASIAQFLASKLINKACLSIFDPAYGKGSLLLAAEAELWKKGNKKIESLLYGCDKSPSNGHLKHLPDSNFLKMDFFDYPLENKYDVILMNPPFVRHHLISNSRKKKYLKKIVHLCKIKWRSDLWSYFLIKAVGHLNVSGSIGAILPRSFLQADYSQDIRSWLADNFSEIQALSLGEDYFDKAQEKIVLVWLQGFGKESNSIKVSFAQHISEDITYSDLSKNRWRSDSIVFSYNHNIEKIIQKYLVQYNFIRFEEIAKIKIGIVTGADRFFILGDKEAKDYGFLDNQLVPIFTSSKDMPALYLNGNQPSKRLLLISKNHYKKFKHYILEGEEKKYHLRAHSLRRDSWYSVEVGIVPDAFFPYRVSLLPFLVRNDRKVQCTNSIHRIYFKDLSINQIKWLQISQLSIPGQLSLEAYSKTYGSGVLKIEPKSLKRSIIYKSNDPSIDTVYYQVSELISLNKKIEAVNLATEFINEKLKISTKFSNITKSALIELQNRRLKTVKLKDGIKGYAAQ